MCVANAFESNGTELFLGFSMQKPGLIGLIGLMVELVRENAEVDHNELLLLLLLLYLLLLLLLLFLYLWVAAS